VSQTQRTLVLADPETGFADAFSDPTIVDKVLKIASPKDAWAASEISGVEVGLADGKVRLLVKIQTTWDEEHTVGAYFDDWQFMELNGSV
jgi:hypothetical protein